MEHKNLNNQESTKLDIGAIISSTYHQGINDSIKTIESILDYKSNTKWGSALRFAVNQIESLKKENMRKTNVIRNLPDMENDTKVTNTDNITNCGYTMLPTVLSKEREILFRGKLKSGDKWIYGMPTYDFQYIFNDDNLDSPDRYEVNPKTIGLFSTIYDKNKKRIFEGDLFKLGSEKNLFEVRFEHGCFLAYLKGNQFGIIGELQTCFIDVVGNIHDNPELLEIMDVKNYNNKK